MTKWIAAALIAAAVTIVACGSGGGGGGGGQTYTVTYNANAATGGSVPTDTNSYEQGQTVTVPGNTGSLVKSGNTFVGWNTQADGNGTTYATGQTFVMGAANVILYAKWSTNPTYKVFYIGNNNTGGSAPIDTNNYEQGQTVTALGNTGNLVKSGYTFAGWNTQADGSGTTYTTGQSFVMGTAEVTLYAKWALWVFVDGGGANGINKNATALGSYPQMTTFNSKLYAAWQEYSSGAFQIRVAVYNGNDGSPSWTFVDGTGAYGINKNVARSAYKPQLTVLNSKLYATWYESDSVGYVTQVRVAVYNGNDDSPSWSFVDGNGTYGLNKDNTKIAYTPQLTAFNSKLYATWMESIGTIHQIRVAVYNGNDGSPTWSFADGTGTDALNKDATSTAGGSQLTVFNSKLYAIWDEYYGPASQARVAVYNGNDGSPSWSFVDGNGVYGINKDVTKNVRNAQLTVFNSKLYATWNEPNAAGVPQIRIRVYNGNDSSPSWVFVDGNGANGINKDVTKAAEYPQLTVSNAKLYATWNEPNAAGVDQIRIKVYNGNDGTPSWMFVDGDGTNGINKDATKPAAYSQLTAFNFNLYAIWHEGAAASQIRVAVAD